MPLRRMLYRVRAFLNRRAADASMDAEMRYHIECEVADRIARGMPVEEARRTARRDFGGVDRYAEETRDQRGFRALEELGQDTRHTVRVLRRNPGYTIAAALTFALGIGLTTAIFSVVYGVLLQPLPYTDPDRLVVVWERNPAHQSQHNVVSVANFEAWRERNRSFTGLAALVPSPVIVGGDDPERVMGVEVSPEYFRLLGARAAIGRELTAGDAQDGAARSVILSDGLWRRRFGGDRSIVGRAIRLDEKPFTVVGIMAADFDPPKFGWLPDHELWLPFVATPGNRSWGRFLLVIGRLRDGISLEAARRDMTAIAGRLALEDKKNEGWTASVVGLAEQITGEVRRPLLVLMGAVALLLLMAAANVGSLTLGFMQRRAQELAVRRAIGASRGRVFRQLLTHAVILGAIGCVVGLLTAIAGTRLILALLPPELPRSSSIRVDAAVLSFTALVGMLTTLGVGIVATLRSLSGDVRSLAIARGPAGRASGRLGSGSLVIGEIALGVVLTVFAGLMIRSFVNLRAVDLGFDARGVVTARVSLPTASYSTPERQRTFFDAWGERVAAVPGVQTVSFATARPLACCAPMTGVSLPGEPLPPAAASMTVAVRFVDSSFFAALRIPLVAGSGFASRETPGGPERVVVNRTLARVLWPGANPVGRRLQVALYNGLDAKVLGVAGDVHLVDPRTPPRATVYLPTARYPNTVRDIIVRTTLTPDAVVHELRATLRSLDPTLPLHEVTTLTDAVGRSVARDRFTTALLSVFAIVSLLLAAVGIYGVFAAEVTARHKEIGVRLALGARETGVLKLVLGRALVLAVTGAGIGVTAGLLLARPMSALVFDVATWDPLSFAAVVGLLLGVALAATLVPALRAARISPLEAIRGE
jgi:putative ABC transport system permease protein